MAKKEDEEKLREEAQKYAVEMKKRLDFYKANPEHDTGLVREEEHSSFTQAEKVYQQRLKVEDQNEAEISDMIDKAEFEKNNSGKPHSDMSYTKKAWDEEFKKRGVTYDQALEIRKKRSAEAEKRLMEKSKKTILEAGE